MIQKNDSRRPKMTQLTVLVTGATAGFGEAVARRYLSEGHKVVAAGRRTERLEALKKSLPIDQQERLHTVVLDVTDKDAVFALPAALPANFAGVSVLVNNAGLALGLEIGRAHVLNSSHIPLSRMPSSA